MRKLFFTPLLFCTLPIFCQEKEKEMDVTDLFKITVLNPGLSYEKRIGKFQTLYFQAFMNLSATRSSGFGNDVYKYYFDPAITAQYRYYYNFKGREDKGLRTSMNNLNYVAPVYQVFFSEVSFTTVTAPDKKRPVHAVAAVWGMQRNYTKARFALDVNIGPGMLFANTTQTDPFNGTKTTISQSQFTLYGQLNIGFWLNKQDHTDE